MSDYVLEDLEEYEDMGWDLEAEIIKKIREIVEMGRKGGPQEEE